MSDDLPNVVEKTSLPTLTDVLQDWLGFQLPSLPMPQTIRNLDKAASVIVLAAGENAVARIKASTAHDLPLNLHPIAIRVSADVTPFGAG